MANPINFLKFYTGSEQPSSRTPSFRSMRISQSGMSAQLVRMETIATNIANAETTRVGAPGSGPYQRRVVQTEVAPAPGAPPEYPALLPLDPAERDASVPTPDLTLDTAGVETVAIVTDPTEGPLVYDPGHPDANELGYVRMPNVRVTDEITDLMDARRLYEANASVFQAAKLMLRRALDI
jgi:flagellar basal-body rod protein FlgC